MSWKSVPDEVEPYSSPSGPKAAPDMSGRKLPGWISVIWLDVMSRISVSVSGKTGVVSPWPHRLMRGMMISDDSAPPATMMVAIRMPRM